MISLRKMRCKTLNLAFLKSKCQFSVDKMLILTLNQQTKLSYCQWKNCKTHTEKLILIMGLSTDFMGIIPDWELVVLLLFLAIFVLVCVMACIKCSQFACEESNLNFCPTCAANEFHIQRRKKKISTERTRLLW